MVWVGLESPRAGRQESSWVGAAVTVQDGGGDAAWAGLELEMMRTVMRTESEEYKMVAGIQHGNKSIGNQDGWEQNVLRVARALNRASLCCVTFA